MSLDIIIRKFVAEDVTNLITLFDESQPGAIAEDIEVTRQYLLDYAANPDSDTYFLAEMNGKLIGYILGIPLQDLNEDDPLMEIVDNPDNMYYCEMVFVTDSQRGQGVSKLLYKTIMDYAISQGYNEIISMVSGDNEASLSLHRSFGMQEELLRKSFVFRLRLTE